VKLARFLLILVAAVPVVAQSGLEHGHKIGSNITYLEESSGGAQSAEILANLKIQFAEVPGNPGPSSIPVVVNPGALNVAVVVNQKPCAAFETWAEQTTSDFAESATTGVGGIKRTEGKVVMQRFVQDNLRQIYASYRVTVETLPNERYRVSFEAPDPPLQWIGKEGWKVFSPAKYPAPQIMKDEDSIRLVLYSNGGTSNTTGNATRRVVDYIHIGRQDRMVFRKEAPHDSYADDAELAVSQPRLRVNGEASAAFAAMPETIRGPVLWVYVPGRGRFMLSLHANADIGFEEAGEVVGNSLTFTAPDGNLFRIDTAERIAPGSGTYAVHVLPVPDWMPADRQDRARVMIGASVGVAADRR
jgi:hypothetical protein